ncbi:hypothetical protein [Comamonas sp. JUb58]|uniref:hypothetical protein n=1 Tax=Comamonas sp. JUb58 TaxID=2485114 RepID=UPI00105E1A24|nr:hypothetical protein [Comamonas sp. JUb58]TDS82595.1 hypothetical protein EDF71_107231 [Comamonas sp. JUb58]
MTTDIKTPKDALSRVEWRDKLRDSMRAGLAAQGAFGVRQNKDWLKVYKRAQKFIKREMLMVKTSKKLIQHLEDVCRPYEEAL